MTLDLEHPEQLREAVEAHKRKNEEAEETDDDFVIETNKKNKKQPRIENIEGVLENGTETEDPDKDTESDISVVEPPSPLNKMDKVYANTWDKEYENGKKTPERRSKKPRIELEALFELEIDLKNKMVQLLSWKGAGRKDEITLKMSDGTTWTECKLNEAFCIYLVGKVIQENYVFQILEYSGSVNDHNLKLVRKILQRVEIQTSLLFQTLDVFKTFTHFYVQLRR